MSVTRLQLFWNSCLFSNFEFWPWGTKIWYSARSSELHVIFIIPLARRWLCMSSSFLGFLWHGHIQDCSKVGYVSNPTSFLWNSRSPIRRYLKYGFIWVWGCSSNYNQNTGDAAQTATTWKMRSKIKSTITMPFSPYVLVLFAHSCDLTLMVQHNESRGDKCWRSIFDYGQIGQTHT